MMFELSDGNVSAAAVCTAWRQTIRPRSLR